VPLPDYCVRGELAAFGSYRAFMSHPYTLLGIVCAVLLLGLAACEREGPAEKAGRNLDRAVKDAGDALKRK
jgi:hypothetical protein